MAFPFLIAIAGPSCSGKSTLARELASVLPATIFTLDSYYHDLTRLPLSERAKTNFDHPDSIDSTLIIRHIEALMQGEEIERPVYDFATHTRTDHIEKMRSRQFLIIEGLFTLYWRPLRELASLKIFMEAGSDVCLPRRQARDIAERGRTVESVVQQYAATVQPMTSRFITPTREFADLVLSGTDSAEKSAIAVLDFMLLRQAPSTAQTLTADQTKIKDG